jgi:hypothetical protein
MKDIPLDLNSRLTLARRQQQIAKVGYVAGSSMIAIGVLLLYLNQPRLRLVEQGATNSPVRRLAVVPTISADMFSVQINIIH